MFIRKFIKDLRGIPRIIQKLQYMPSALVDPNGFGFLNLMFENANVPNKYRYMFFPEEEGAVFIDCGMNVGLITDIARYMGMEIYGFEPNPIALKYILNKKYLEDCNVHIYPYAIADKEGEIDFYINPNLLFDQGATIYKEFAEIEGDGRLNNKIKVKTKKLNDIIRNDILPRHNHIHLLKMDIEGAEFGVINDIINEGLYKDITHIVIETHESYFKNGKKMINDLKRKIKDNNIDNIHLDWI